MLDRAREYFAKHVAAWAEKNPGGFAVVKDESLVGIYSTMEEAIAAGAHRFGLQSFLVRQLGAKPEEIVIPALALGLLRAHS